MCLPFIFWGCVKPVEKGSYLLYNQSVKGTKQLPAEQLEALIPQKPNRRILRTPIMPYLTLYRFGEQFYKKETWEKKLATLNEEYEQKSLLVQDKPKEFDKLRRQREKKTKRYELKINEGNNFMRIFGEPPAYYSEIDTKSNVNNLLKYLFSKGFFRATVSYKTDTLLFNTIRVTYQVDEKCPYLLKETSVVTTDSRIDSILKAHSHETFLKPNTRYDAELVVGEHLRYEQLLRSNGYFYFSRDYIRPQAFADTTHCDSVQSFVSLKMRIDNPPKRPNHPYFYLGSTKLIVDGSSDVYDTPIDTTYFNGIDYLFIGRHYSTKILDSKIYLRPGKIFNINDLYETQRQLANLEQFKFANPSFDSTGNMLKTQIYTVPLEKYQFTSETGFSVFQQVPGPFGNVVLRVRNIFKGLESLETNLRAGYEGQTGFFLNDSSKVYQSLEFSANTSLMFPQILFPGKIASRFNKFNPRTQVGVGFNFTNRPEYNRSNFKLAMNYTWQLNQQKAITLSLLDFNYIQSKFKLKQFEDFLLTELQNGNNLYYSFQPSLVSSISASYTYNGNILGQNKKSSYFKLFFESGGTTLNFLKPNAFGFLEGVFGQLRYYRYLKINGDYRYYLPIGKKNKTTLAMRVNGGIAFAYSSDDVNVLPYEKYFFAGGTNSIRAWRLRRLGPGSSAPSQNTTNSNFTPESPGDILLESSIEYRFPLFKMGGMLNGALFIDAGNVWNLRNISNNEKAVFQADRFFKEIAIGTGFGIRYDFTYFVIRGDFGLRVHDPSRELGDRWVIFRKDVQNKLLFNLGIGYPF